jgi:arabinofuranosyltransferase
MVAPMPSLRTADDPPTPWGLSVLLALAVGGAVLGTAWISDDALVTFRTAENVATGEGMRWNVLDRTQTATHPLWVLLLAAGRWCTGELYFTTIVISVLLSSLGAMAVARAVPRGAAGFAVLGLGLLGSRSFVEFGTCGLENALVYTVLGAFTHAWFRLAPGVGRVRRLGLLGALAALSRQDLVLLVAPCVLAACRGLPWRAVVRALAPGFLLGCVWYGFAIVYYGTAIPTPGYGKVIAADVPAAALFEQGLWYLADLVRRDPTAALVLLGAIVAGMLSRTALLLAPALGVLLQVVYTLRVGGDFMSGRFFTAAFVPALAVVACVGRGRVGLAGAFVLAVAMFATGLPPWLRGTPTQAEYAIWHGIGSERAYYSQQLGLWSSQRVPFTYAMFGRAFAGRARPVVMLHHAAGVPGYLNGPYVHVVDPFLCDPLLMRLPLQDPLRWRIGHFKRRLPEGWLETLASGENRLRHPALARYWDALEVLLRAPVFSAARWRVWWGFQLGEYEPLLQQYVREAYHTPPLVEVEASALPAGLTAGVHWYDVAGVVLREGGLRVRLPAPASGRTLRLLCDGGGSGEVVFRRSGAEVARLPYATPVELLGGARWLQFAVPEAASGFDVFDVLPRSEAGSADAAITVLEVFAVLGLDLRD